METCTGQRAQSPGRPRSLDRTAFAFEPVSRSDETSRTCWPLLMPNADAESQQTDPDARRRQPPPQPHPERLNLNGLVITFQRLIVDRSTQIGVGLAMGRRSDAKARLVAGADGLFRDHGFAAVGVAQLCGAAVVNKGSFYHFFPSKQALLLEVVAAAWDDTGMFRQWESQVPTQPTEQIGTFPGGALRLSLR